MKISENTNIGLPLRNLIGLISAIVIGAWFAFGVIERLNRLETKNQLFEKDLLEASVQKPIDQEQFMLIEYMTKQIEKHAKQLEDNVHTGVMLKQYEKEIEKLKKDVERLKDQTRDIKFTNGNGKH
jgi:HAMP domain-containing protein|tara:strand:- start:1401 stop:1778 length:378 start_codon:yes stop_codon:yes gene_type:complete